MTEVTTDLMFEVLENLQQRKADLELVAIEHPHGLNALRAYAGSIRTDTTNIYGVLSRIDQRLDGIERRPELRKLTEPHRPLEPHP